MSIIRSISRFITTTFDTATATIGTVEKGLDIGNHWVAENHKRITMTTTTNAQMSVARFNDEVALELEASARLQTQYDEVVIAWNETPAQTAERHRKRKEAEDAAKKTAPKKS